MMTESGRPNVHGNRLYCKLAESEKLLSPFCYEADGACFC
jgi:hypothetical protein